jgi:hypothetical protein
MVYGSSPSVGGGASGSAPGQQQQQQQQTSPPTPITAALQEQQQWQQQLQRSVSDRVSLPGSWLQLLQPPQQQQQAPANLSHPSQQQQRDFMPHHPQQQQPLHPQLGSSNSDLAAIVNPMQQQQQSSAALLSGPSQPLFRAISAPATMHQPLLLPEPPVRPLQPPQVVPLGDMGVGPMYQQAEPASNGNGNAAGVQAGGSAAAAGEAAPSAAAAAGAASAASAGDVPMSPLRGSGLLHMHDDLGLTGAEQDQDDQALFHMLA